MDTMYTVALTQLDDSVAEFGGGNTLPDRVTLTLPVEAWVKLGRPTWINIMPTAGTNPTQPRPS